MVVLLKQNFHMQYVIMEKSERDNMAQSSNQKRNQICLHKCSAYIPYFAYVKDMQWSFYSMYKDLIMLCANHPGKH